MDVQMPVLDGVSATNIIRARSGPERRITIIALTANSMEGDKERYLSAGMDGYLSKPMEREKLARVLVDNMGSSTRHRTPFDEQTVP